MSFNIRISAVAGAVAMALAGTSMANTSISSTTGDVFLNVIDTTNSTSFLFDTGITQAAFNANAQHSFDITSALSSFLNTTDSFTYSVVSATRVGTASMFDITGVTTPVIVSSSNNLQAIGSIQNFTVAANAVATASANSVVLSTSAWWGAPLTEGSVSNRLFANTQTPYSDAAAVGTSLAMYNITGAGFTTLPGTWDLVTTLQGGTTDVLSYNVAGTAPVPLPTPLLLLASGLGLMGVVSRRRKVEA
jgi:hypothetical protein